MTCRMVRITSQMMRICCLCYWILLVVSSTTSIVSGKPTDAQTNIHRHHAANNKARRGLLFDSYSFSHILFLFYFFFFDRIIYYIYNESNQASSYLSFLTEWFDCVKVGFIFLGLICYVAGIWHPREQAAGSKIVPNTLFDPKNAPKMIGRFCSLRTFPNEFRSQVF